jgi:hypothetical protein
MSRVRERKYGNGILHSLCYGDGVVIDGVAYGILLGRDVTGEDLKPIREGKHRGILYGPGLSRLSLLLHQLPPMYQKSAARRDK